MSACRPSPPDSRLAVPILPASSHKHGLSAFELTPGKQEISPTHPLWHTRLERLESVEGDDPGGDGRGKVLPIERS
jgi:hypothetical protein